MKFYFTFGFGHHHGPEKKPLNNCYTIIEGETENEARLKMHERRGLRYCTSYPSAEAAGVDKWDLHFIPFSTIKDQVNEKEEILGKWENILTSTNPEDFIDDNERRRAWGKEAVRQGSDEANECPATGVTDTLSNIRHLCAHIGVDFDDCVRVSKMHFAAEAGED